MSADLVELVAEVKVVDGGVALVHVAWDREAYTIFADASELDHATGCGQWGRQLQLRTDGKGWTAFRFVELLRDGEGEVYAGVYQSGGGIRLQVWND